MNITVVTSCTGTKTVDHSDRLTLADFRRGNAHVTRRAARLPCTTAEEMYAGQHHVRLMRGVRALRAAGAEVTVWIVSAGYGLVRGSRVLAPYEATFIGMGKAAAAAWADELRIADDVQRVLEQPADGALVLLGDDYLAACDYLAGVESEWVTAVCGVAAAQKIPGRIRRIVLSTADASRLHVGLVAMKGEVGRRMLEWLAADRRRTFARAREAIA